MQTVSNFQDKFYLKIKKDYVGQIMVFLFENWKLWWVIKFSACRKVSNKCRDYLHVF